MTKKRKQNVNRKKAKGKKTQQSRESESIGTNIVIEKNERLYNAYTPKPLDPSVSILPYPGEEALQDVIALLEADLSEPYSVFTYRNFLNSRPNLSFVAMVGDNMVGVVMGKMEPGPDGNRVGYVGMIAVDVAYRRLNIGTHLMLELMRTFIDEGALSVFLETECSNLQAIRFYEKLGFYREEYFYQYYLNGNDAYRLRLYVDPSLYHFSPSLRELIPPESEEQV